MAQPKRIAVIGAGAMARMRGKALLESGAEIVGVAARSEESAAKMASQLGGKAFSDYTKLESLDPDGVLIEVPHDVQDAITLAAISWGCGVLVGAPLAYSSASAENIYQKAAAANVPVEAGFHARYSSEWIDARKVIREGILGDIIGVQSIAIYPRNPERWNYRQAEGGGMPLSLMTFYYVNPLRWLLGEPLQVSAIANRKKHMADGLVEEETCAAMLMFDNHVICTMLCGYVSHEARPRASVYVLGTEGAMELSPCGLGQGTITIHREGVSDISEYGDTLPAFAAQAKAFLETLDGTATLRNPAKDARHDIRVANAIAEAARTGATVPLA